jgi:hypothetical protein
VGCFVSGKPNVSLAKLLGKTGTITYGLIVPAASGQEIAQANEDAEHVTGGLATISVVHRTRGYVFKLDGFIGNKTGFEH